VAARVNKNDAKPPLKRADGWLVQHPIIGDGTHHPVRSYHRMLRDIFMAVAATPPWLRRGIDSAAAISTHSRHLPATNLLDARVEKTLRFGEAAKASVRVDVFNVLNVNTVRGVTSRSGGSFAVPDLDQAAAHRATRPLVRLLIAVVSAVRFTAETQRDAEFRRRKPLRKNRACIAYWCCS
jgi:hypothetical protein